MDVHTYLKYNNVALVDPTVSFHASCIKQFNEKGYLSAKQLEHLRGWNHSSEAIMRLTAGLEESHSSVEAPTVSAPVVKKTRWSNEELDELFNMVISSNSKLTLDELATEFSRTPSAIQATLYKHSDCTIKRGRVIQCEITNSNDDLNDELPF